MADKKEENLHARTTSCSDKDLFGGNIDMDAIDWGAVARSYKLLGLRESDRQTFERSEKLLNDYNRWVAKRVNRIEFDIALRMHFDEIITAERFLSAPEDDPMNPDISEIALKNLAAACRGNMKMRCPEANKTKETAKIEDQAKPKIVV